MVTEERKELGGSLVSTLKPVTNACRSILESLLILLAPDRTPVPPNASPISQIQKYIKYILFIIFSFRLPGRILDARYTSLPPKNFLLVDSRLHPLPFHPPDPQISPCRYARNISGLSHRTCHPHFHSSRPRSCSTMCSRVFPFFASEATQKTHLNTSYRSANPSMLPYDAPTNSVIRSSSPSTAS